MAIVTEQDVLNALRQVQEPELHRDLVTLNMVKDVACDKDKVSFRLELTTPACPLRGQIEKEAKDAVMKLPGVKEVVVKLSAEVNRDSRLFDTKALPEGIKNIVAVGSGKGGVGKSTATVNLAAAIAQEGAQVGILDADIYGPNIPMMMGAPENCQPGVDEKQHLIPIERQKMKLISIGFLLPPGKPLIWRGPMLHGVIRQFLTSVAWGELDYLFVDLPPGTGDAPLSLVQMVPLTGAVIVTTPQQVALSDVRRAIGMFKEVRVPILGILENMSDLFDGNGGEILSKEYEVPLLGQVPFERRVSKGGDTGQPIVVSDPSSPAGQAFQKAAEWVAARISVLNAQSREPMTIKV